MKRKTNPMSHNVKHNMAASDNDHLFMVPIMEQNHCGDILKLLHTACFFLICRKGKCENPMTPLTPLKVCCCVIMQTNPHPAEILRKGHEDLANRATLSNSRLRIQGTNLFIHLFITINLFI